MARSIKNLVAATLISLSGFLLLTSVWPSYQFSNNLKEIITQRLDALNNREEIIDEIKKAESKKNDHYAELQRLSAVLPMEENIPEIISMIDSIFSTNGVVVDVFKISQSKKIENELSPILIEVGSTGSYNDILSLISAIQRNIRLFDIASVGISEKQNPDYLGQLSFSIKGNVYWLRSSKVFADDFKRNIRTENE